uniref:Uncharacterized protein n=1 Tax=Rhizophora mucronata TaxID=61149 RepID=A0A2P2PYD2_RHIMU
MCSKMGYLGLYILKNSLAVNSLFSRNHFMAYNQGMFFTVVGLWFGCSQFLDRVRAHSTSRNLC